MESYLIIEPIVLILWIALVYRSTKRGVLFTAFSLPIAIIPFVVVGEIFNASLGIGGVYYPGSYFWFPGYRFPLALLLMGGVYGWILKRFCEGLSSFGKTKSARGALLVAGYVIGLAFCYPFEILATSVDYWVIRTSAQSEIELLGVLIYYAFVCLPGLLIDRFVGRRFAEARIEA